jgi:hypothetical protein
MSRDREDAEEREYEQYTGSENQRAPATDSTDDTVPEKEAEQREEATAEAEDQQTTEPTQDTETGDGPPVDLSRIPPASRPQLIDRSPRVSSQQGNVKLLNLEAERVEVSQPTLQTSSVTLQQTAVPITGRSPQQTVSTDRAQMFNTVSEVDLSRVTDQLGDTTSLGANELEFEDPFHNWSGESPYGSDHPAVVLHVSPENRRGDSVALLERRLRDAYTQEYGGTPEAKGVRLVANKPKIPSLSNTVVTFDLTGEEWEIQTDSQPIAVERNGQDALEYISEAVRNSYAGDLGYLIVNLPERWRDPLVPGDVFEQIRQRLLPDEDVDETVDADTTPQITRCEPIDSEILPSQAARYWFGTSELSDIQNSEDQRPSVEALEERFNNGLRQQDWLGTVLTTEDEAESTEHYHLKASIAAGAARTLYDASRATNLNQYVINTLLDDDVIKSEAEDNNKRMDLRIEWKDSLDSFFPEQDDDSPSNIAVEVETGRGQAAASFRKIWQTVKRLEQKSPQADLVVVVIPPRLLLQRKSQASHLLKLIELWNERVESQDDNALTSLLGIPVFNTDGNCTRIRAAESLVQEVYGDDD